MKLEIVLEAVDRLTAPVERVRARLRGLAAPINAIGAATARLGRAAGVAQLANAIGTVASRATNAAQALAQVSGRALALGGALTAGGLALFSRQFLSGAAEMERFRITLTQVEGSAAAADRALSWVSDFATRTPFELAEVTRAFVNVRNLGIDPTNGALEAAGDAAAIMGTRYEEAVGALSAALRGEMDPLERFGVFARTEGENIVLNWEHQGRRMRSAVNKNNREMIAQIIQSAWAQKFGGGMAQLSRSWTGMMSNLQDAWSRWTLAVMNAGVFDWLRARLSGLLATVNTMASNGQLESWARATSSALIRAFTAVEDFLLGQREIVMAGDGAGDAVIRTGGIFERIAASLKRADDAFTSLHDAISPIIGPFGRLEAVLVALAVVLAGPLIAGIGSLTGALVALGAALISNPIGWAILAIGALAALGTLLYQNWDGVLGWFKDQWEALPGPVQAAVRIITAPIRGLIALVDLLGDAWNGAADAAERLMNLLPSVTPSPTGPLNSPDAQQRRRDFFRERGRLYDLPAIMGEGVGPSSFAPSGAGSFAPSGAGSFAPSGADRVDLGGTLRIRIEDGRVTSAGRMNDPRARLDVDQGLLVAGA